ncbi:MAG: gamma-glutamyltransferase [Bacteroidetes bacterium]|nr:gamma-glutamyltransferase [Bacteroidota bacterium]
MKSTILTVLLFCLYGGVMGQYENTIVGPTKAVNPYQYSVVKSGTFNRASVSSAHPLASMVGTAIMQQGGNAFDATIATQLALAVVYPGAGNIGGGGFTLARKKDGTLIGIDFREAAPAKASRDMYLDAAGNAQDALSQSGHLASGVPGTVAGIFATYAHAKLPFAMLIQPAIDLARYGFVITEKEAASLNGTKKDFVQYSTRPSAFVKDTKWKVGDTLVQLELANTLTRIQKNGAKGFYEGETAALIVDEMKRGGGLITLDDLKNYQAKSRTPIVFNYRGYGIISFAPPSSGGILIGQMLKMIEPFNVQKMGFQTPESVQLMIEIERRAYADRAAHIGDPDFYKVPQKTLLQDTYLKNRMSDYKAGVAGSSTQTQAGTIKTSEETTHFSVVDPEGNMVAVTTTLNGGYGNRTVVGGAGFLLNNEMDDFSAKPGSPNMYGAIGGEANSIEPHKRMLSSMTPTLLTKNNKPFLTVGTPGGTTIPTSVFQTIVNIVDFNMSLEDAINNPKFHHQWLPDEVSIEKTFSQSTKEALEKMGYLIKTRGSIGRTEGILIGPTGKRITVADKRGDDAVAGF